MNSFSKISKNLALTVFLLLSFTLTPTAGSSYTIPNEKDVLKSFGFPSQNSLAKRLNILVWNFHKGEDTTFATDFIDLTYKKDLIMGQEMLLNPAMNLVFGSLPQYFFNSATSFYMGKELDRTGVMTASPVSPSAVSYIRTLTLEPIVNSPKVTLVSRYPLKSSSRTLTVVNIHGINFVDNASYRSEINRIYEAIKKYPAPMIFAGDFNSWNDERNAILAELCVKLKLKEARFFPDHRMRFNKHPLDHFFYTEDIRIIEAKVEEFYQGSDHKPLEVTLEYSTEDLPSSLLMAKRQ